MQTIVELTKSELEVFLCIYKRKGIPGINDLSPQSELDQNILDQMINKGYFHKDENKKRLVDSFIELVLLTILKPESRLECYRNDSDFHNIYFHGNTIVLLTKQNNREVYTLMWIPTLSIAIGALIDYFNQVPVNSNNLVGSIVLDNIIDEDSSPQRIIEYLKSYGNHEIGTLIEGDSSLEIITIKTTNSNNDIHKVILLNEKNISLLIEINNRLVHWKSINQIQLISMLVRCLTTKKIYFGEVVE